MKTISPTDQLPPGTRISVNGKRGTILKAETARDQFGGPIIVHTVQLTHRVARTFANRYKLVPLKKPIVQQCNYSFICPID